MSTVLVLMGPALVSDEHSVSTHGSGLGVRSDLPISITDFII